MHRITKATSVFGLSRMNSLLDHCGNPHLALRAVHIAGTKGKGSTAAMLASILRASGLKVGLYTSPHLTDIRERIQVNGECIPEESVTRHLGRLRPYLEAAEQGGDIYAPTFFEAFTVISFLHFLEEAVDVAVVEVGLGGRLDATNVLRPQACAITPVSFDHTDKLGTELHQIAGEKAGIIKQNTPVVSGLQRPEALAVIRRKAEELNAPLRVVGEDIVLTAGGESFAVRTWKREIGGLSVPLIGRHQQENAATAVGLAELMNENGSRISDDDIRAGLRSVRWPGRIQIVSRDPEIIVDGAHNELSIQVLLDALATLPPRRTIFVLGIARDKDVPSMLRLLAGRGDAFIVTKTANPRAADPAELKRILEEHGAKNVTAAATPAEALELARKTASPADRICFTGSMYLAGDVLVLMNDKCAQSFGI